MLNYVQTQRQTVRQIDGMRKARNREATQRSGCVWTVGNESQSCLNASLVHVHRVLVGAEVKPTAYIEVGGRLAWRKQDGILHFISLVTS